MQDQDLEYMRECWIEELKMLGKAMLVYAVMLAAYWGLVA